MYAKIYSVYNESWMCPAFFVPLRAKAQAEKKKKTGV